MGENLAVWHRKVLLWFMLYHTLVCYWYQIPFIYIYIYIYISVCVCVCVLKRLICSEPDSMIEICGKLDKSNTSLNFTCVIFRSALFHLHKLLQERACFLSFSLCLEKVREDGIKPNEISHIYIWVKCFIYPTFPIFISNIYIHDL